MAAREVNSVSDPQAQDAYIINVTDINIDCSSQATTDDDEKVITTPRNGPSNHLFSDENRKLFHMKRVNLYKAAARGDFKEATRFFGDVPRQILCASITEGEETVLHVATQAKQTAFVEQLMRLMQKDDLALQDKNHNTAFCFAAAAGALPIAEIMLRKNEDLAKIRGAQGLTPFYMAVMFTQGKMANFLYDKTRNILTPDDQTALFFTSIRNGLYDMALTLLDDNKDLAVARDRNDETALHVLAQKPLPPSNRSLELLKRIINSVLASDSLSVPGLKFTQDQFKISSHALQLVKNLWVEILKRNDVEVKDLIREPSQLLFDAAKVGNSEFLAELICSYPDLVQQVDENNRSIFHIAVLHRHANVFNLIYEIDFIKDLFATFEDKDKNIILHLAALLPHPSRVNIVSGSALQMQQELLWFKEVEKIVQPSSREKKNSKGETPRELFTTQHEDLLKNGEQWMKKTAEQCMIVATLIATVMFSAAFSVPGGNDEKKGLPIRLRETFFQVFAMVDAIALSSSSISILMFLSILTSRYAEYDFIKSLPLKLMVGLSSLFISIISMMVAFSTTFFLAYHDRLNCVPMLTTVLVFVPVTLFLQLHYPLLMDIFYSTYYSRLLFKPRKVMFG